MARFVTNDCKFGSYEEVLNALNYFHCEAFEYTTLDYLDNKLDISCVGMNIQQSRNFPIDTTATGVVIGTRFSQQWLTEQHPYGSARLGIDRERRLLADSVRVRRAVFNPVVGWWKEVSVGAATEFGVGNQPEISTNRVGVEFIPPHILHSVL